MHCSGHVFMIGHILAVAALSLEADGVEDGLQIHAAHGRSLMNEKKRVCITFIHFCMFMNCRLHRKTRTRLESPKEIYCRFPCGRWPGIPPETVEANISVFELVQIFK